MVRNHAACLPFISRGLRSKYDQQQLTKCHRGINYMIGIMARDVQEFVMCKKHRLQQHLVDL